MTRSNNEFSVSTVLLDIEGTLSSQSFVTQVLYPYVSERLRDYVAGHADDSVVSKALADTRQLSGKPDEDPVDSLLGWLAEDLKAPPLKKLQGLVWESGFLEGAFQGQIYPDALKALQHWHAQGIPLVIYSSGSVQCQKQFYQYNEAGDLLYLFSGYFDTDVGAKVESSSYTRITGELSLSPSEVLFLSDNPRELVAAQSAGLQVVQVLREGTPPDPRFLAIADFAEITVAPLHVVPA
jgi:enolase-phosphatase E1